MRRDWLWSYLWFLFGFSAVNLVMVFTGYVVPWLGTVVLVGIAVYWLLYLTTRRKHGHRQAGTGDRGSGAGGGPGVSLPFFSAVATSTSFFSAVATSTGAREGQPELATVYSDDPLRGWKYARLAWVAASQQARLLPITRSVPHEVDARASCAWLSYHYRLPDGSLVPITSGLYAAPPVGSFRIMFPPGVTVETSTEEQDHDVPDLGCSCGFYSLKEKPESIFDSRHMEGEVLLEVDLLGRVIECERGYRAARQRILKVYVKSKCLWCDDPATAVTMEDLALVHGGLMVPVCSKHSHGLNFTLSELANQLGTEVSWA